MQRKLIHVRFAQLGEFHLHAACISLQFPFAFSEIQTDRENYQYIKSQVHTNSLNIIIMSKQEASVCELFRFAV